MAMEGGVLVVREDRRGARPGRNTSNDLELSRHGRWGNTANAAAVNNGGHGETVMLNKWGYVWI